MKPLCSASYQTKSGNDMQNKWKNLISPEKSAHRFLKIIVRTDWKVAIAMRLTYLLTTLISKQPPKDKNECAKYKTT